jgi:GxxExxY protein
VNNTERAEEQGTQINQITSEIIGALIRVHTDLGPGLLENAYQVCLHRELELRGLSVKSQVYLPVEYRGTKVKLGYRMDMVVNDCVVVELKGIQVIDALAKAQLLSYLRLSGMKIGLLINFHCYKLTDGICRIINGY